MPRVSVKCMKCCHSKMAARPNAPIIYSFFNFYLHVAHILRTVVLLTVPSTCISDVNVSLQNFNKINLIKPCCCSAKGRFRDTISGLSCPSVRPKPPISPLQPSTLGVLNRLTLIISKTFSVLNRMFWFSCETKGLPLRAQSGSAFTEC